MDQLVEEMEYSKDDFDQRLGKSKSVEIKVEDPSMEEEDDMFGMDEDMDEDEMLGEEPLFEKKPMSPEESLKERILKLKK